VVSHDRGCPKSEKRVPIITYQLDIIIEHKVEHSYPGRYLSTVEWKMAQQKHTALVPFGRHRRMKVAQRLFALSTSEKTYSVSSAATDPERVPVLLSVFLIFGGGPCNSSRLSVLRFPFAGGQLVGKNSSPILLNCLKSVLSRSPRSTFRQNWSIIFPLNLSKFFSGSQEL